MTLVSSQKRKKHLQEFTDKVNGSSKRLNGLAAKTKITAVGRQKVDMDLKLESKKLDKATELTCLWSVMTEDGKCKKDIKNNSYNIGNGE